METALENYNAGRLAPAERICNQIIAVQPRMALAHNLLGAILVGKGDAPAAIKAFRRAVAIEPNNAQFQGNLGEAERRRGKLREAAIALTRAIEINPRAEQAHNNLGIVHFDKEEYEEAAEHYRKAIAIREAYPEAHNNLGNALRMLDKREEALTAYERALMLRENYPEAYNNLATVLRELKQFDEAQHAYRKAIQLSPQYIDAYDNLGVMLAEQERYEDALKVLADALEADAKHIPTLLHVARIQLRKGSVDQAEKAGRYALGIDPENPKIHSLLGDIFMEVDRFEVAKKAYEKALSIDPDMSEAHNQYGNCLKAVGQLDEARDHFRKSLDLNPKGLGVYTNLADLEVFTPENTHFQAMEAIMAEAEDPLEERYTPLHFALGKAYDDLGQYERAIHHYGIGARMKRATLEYNEAETLGFFDDILRVFDKNFVENPPFSGNPTDVPVFIVGMPRSGSTLTEQILSSHPDAFGAGESKEFSKRLSGLRARFPNLPKYPAMALKMNADQYNLVADGYLGALKAVGGDAARITDKMLSNFYFVGLIHTLYPNAKFIHTKRNPVDTCISCFSKMFKDDLPHSYDFAELGRYYLKYQEVMDHWDAVLPPGVMKTVVYEEVVADVETAARSLVDFVGLPWNPACLAFHESSRPVKTASVVQVRKPVYTTSTERDLRRGPPPNT